MQDVQVRIEGSADPVFVAGVVGVPAGMIGPRRTSRFGLPRE